MWGSALVGDEYYAPNVSTDDFTKSVINNLAQHPYFHIDNVPMQKSESSIFNTPDIKSFSFPSNGDGWLESTYGKDADSIIRMCRKLRRHDKLNKQELDGIIEDVRAIKALEVDATIANLSWSDGLKNTICNLGLSDRSLKALRKFGESRAVSLQQACKLWNDADTSLKMLDEFENVWGVEEQNAWASAMKNKSDAKKMWRTTLHQIDKISKNEKESLIFIADELQKSGPLGTGELLVRGLKQGPFHKSMTSRRLGSLLKMYGEEVDVYKGAKNLFVKMDQHGLVLKDIWSYAAGFLDADGSIFISERGDPRATFVATGDRGRAHCESLHKALGCGRLVLNQRIHKNSNRSQHRLVFSSKDDLRQLLKGILPHLQMKGLQAKAVLAYIDEKDKMRKQELYRLVTYNNWKDDTKKAGTYLDKWGIDADIIGNYAEGL